MRDAAGDRGASDATLCLVNPTLEGALLITAGVALVFGIGYAARREARAVAAMHALMRERGFTLEPQLPPVDSGRIKLDPRFGWRGTLATGQPVVVFAGRGFGDRIAPEARMTSTGHHFYVWALLSDAPSADAWRGRWTGDARALPQSGGSTLVYWQRDYIAPNLARSLDELAASLRE